MVYNHVHCHTEFSELDGLSRCEEAAEHAAASGSTAIAVTDHGVCSGHPESQRAADKAGIKPVFGMEGYFIGDRIFRPPKGDKEAQAQARDYRHMVLLAENDQGLRDLWAISTEAYTSGFYHKPRLDWALLERYSSHLVATSACLGGIVSKDILAGRYDDVLRKLARLKALFGDRFYLEIGTIGLHDQIRLNKMLVTMSDHLKIPLVAASDGHYTGPERKEAHDLWLACRTSPSQEDYWHYVHMQNEDEVRRSLSYLDRRHVDSAIANTTEITDRCNARISGRIHPPVFTPGGTARDDSMHLLDLCLSAMRSGRVPLQRGLKREYLQRLEYEWQEVARKGLAGCYLIVRDICSWVRSQGAMVGPGRGSAAGSLMSYLAIITAIDPLQAGLMFERFLTPGRISLPDFDIDLPSSMREPVGAYVVGKYGEDKVLRVGTHTRYRNKGILNKLFSVMAPQLSAEADTERREIAAIIDEAESHTAGLGLPWDDMMEQCSATLGPYVDKYPEVFQRAAELVGLIHTHGKHAAGVVISTDEPLLGTLPMWMGEDGKVVSQWDFRDVEAIGRLKIDLLTLRTLDTIQQAVQLIEKRAGVQIDFLAWKDEYEDPQVWEEIGTGYTLGMFQVETSLGQQACRRMRPVSISELADLITYVRPGPRNSGMAESYLRRRAGAEEITYPHPLLEDHLRRTYGVMLYQEDVLTASIVLAGYDGGEADDVRKVLGKKLIDKIAGTGEKFVRRCVEKGHDEDQVKVLWESMAEFGRYGFNRSHAYSYSMLAYWTAWLKTHYPVEGFTAILSTVDKDDIPGFVVDARRLGVRVLPPGINSCASGFEPGRLSIQYGMDAIKGIGLAAVTAIAGGQPYQSYNDVIRQPGLDKGIVYSLARAGALDELVPSRRALVRMLEAAKAGDLDRCVHKDEAAKGPGGLPCTFDWAAEPLPEPKMGKRGMLKVVRKPPPRRCTRACRNYTPPAAPELDTWDYRPAELWRLEKEIFGCWLTDRIFAQLDSVAPGLRKDAAEFALKFPLLPEGTYPLPAVHNGLRAARTRRGSTMWWLSLATEVSYLSIAVFSPRNDDEPDISYLAQKIPEGTLVAAEIAKGRYWNGTEWRDSLRLESLRRLA